MNTNPKLYELMFGANHLYVDRSNMCIMTNGSDSDRVYCYKKYNILNPNTYCICIIIDDVMHYVSRISDPNSNILNSSRWHVPHIYAKCVINKWNAVYFKDAKWGPQINSEYLWILTDSRNIQKEYGSQLATRAHLVFTNVGPLHYQQRKLAIYEYNRLLFVPTGKHVESVSVSTVDSTIANVVTKHLEVNVIDDKCETTNVSDTSSTNDTVVIDGINIDNELDDWVIMLDIDDISIPT